MPIEDVTLDWSVVGRRTVEGGADVLDVLLVAIPNEIVARYVKIAQTAGLELRALESESFGLARALIGLDKSPLCLVDVGASSTDITIVDEGTVRIAHNFDIAGIRLSGTLARSLQVTYSRADTIKQESGLKPRAGEKNIIDIITPLVDLIIAEISRFVADYAAKTNRKVARLILSGGSARLPGFAEYFAEKLGFNVTIANPFGSLLYPPLLDKKLKIIGPSYGVTVGMAMRHFVQ